MKNIVLQTSSNSQHMCQHRTRQNALQKSVKSNLQGEILATGGEGMWQSIRAGLGDPISAFHGLPQVQPKQSEATVETMNCDQGNPLCLLSSLKSSHYLISSHSISPQPTTRTASYPFPIPNVWDRFHPIPHPEVQPTHWWGSAARLHCLPKLKKLWVWVGLNRFECEHLPFVNWVNWVKSACLPIQVWPLRQAEKRVTAADFANAKPHTSYYWDRWWNAMGSLKWWGTTAHVNLG